MPHDSEIPKTKVIQSWKAYISPTERVSIENAAGRLASSTIRQYPPGIPDIIPGMTYSDEIISNLEHAYKSGIRVIGVDFAKDRHVDVAVLPTPSNLSGNHNIETTRTERLTHNTIIEIADFFNSAFSAAPYYHFAFHESDPLRALPANLNFRKWNSYLSLPNKDSRTLLHAQLLESAKRSTNHNYTQLELDRIVLPKGFYRWTETDICRRVIQDRMMDSGYVTLVRNLNSNKLVGLLHARKATIKRLFYSEEWHNPLLFSQLYDEILLDEPDRFYQKIRDHFQLQPDDPLMSISAQILHPTVQGGQIFYDMMRSMAQRITPEHAELPLLCEIPPHGTAHTLNTAFTDRIVFGVLRNAHPFVFCQKTSQALFPFIGNKVHWQHTLKSAIQKKKDFKRLHYVPSKSDSLNIIVKPNGDMGLAVFATDYIKAGSRIAVFEGETYKANNALALPEIMRDHAIQTGPKTYVFGYNGLAHRLCHSCQPNCGIRNYTEIFAAQDIEAGEQLTWDYRCSENSTWVLDKCLCGSKGCTGSVKNFDSLPLDMKKDYLKRHMVSEWLREH